MSSSENTNILNTDMPKDLRSEAIECSKVAISKHKTEKEIAAFIKKYFDSQYSPAWHCIVGRNFGSYVTHISYSHIHFYIGEIAILLFRTN